MSWNEAPLYDPSTESLYTNSLHHHVWSRCLDLETLKSYTSRIPRIIYVFGRVLNINSRDAVWSLFHGHRLFSFKLPHTYWHDDDMYDFRFFSSHNHNKTDWEKRERRSQSQRVFTAHSQQQLWNEMLTCAAVACRRMWVRNQRLSLSKGEERLTNSQTYSLGLYVLLNQHKGNKTMQNNTLSLYEVREEPFPGRLLSVTAFSLYPSVVIIIII